MRISELSRAAGVPLATVKFYLREGLLHAGELTSATQARYDETHLARLRLVRALLGPGGLSVTAARSVVQALDAPPPSAHELLGVAHAATRTGSAEPAEHERVHELIRAWGWSVADQHCRTHQAIADALAAIEAAGFELPEEALDVYARAMAEVARYEVEHVPTDSPAAAVRYVVLGTLLVEPLLLALRRAAQQAASATLFGDRPGLSD